MCKQLANSLLYFFFKNKGLIILTLIYWISFVFMLPLRDQAFEDDFAYIQTAYNLLQTGNLHISEWSAAALVFQTLWGGVFLKIFGISISALHFSNILLLFFAVVSFYYLLKRIGLNEFKSAVFSIFLFTFPWVFQFSYSYMSDVFYMSLSILAIYFYINALNNNSRVYFFLGSFFVSMAFIQRQIALLIPASLVIIFIIQFVQNKKINIVQIFSCFTLIILTIIIYNFWVDSSGGPSISYTKHVVEPMKNEFFPRIMPSDLKMIGVTNNFYLESLVQMGLGYFDNTVTFFVPLLLIPLLNIKGLIKLFSKNYKILLAITTLAIFTYFLDILTGQKRTQYLPDKILRYDKIFLYWDILWPCLVWTSRFLWIGIITLTLKFLLNKLFTLKPKLVRTSFWQILFLVSTLFLVFLIFIYHATFSQSFTFDFFKIILQNSYFFLFFYFILFSATIYIFTNYSLNTLTGEGRILIFLAVSTVLNFLMLAFYPYNFYQEYVVQLIPFFVIWVAYILKQVPLNKTLIVISISVTFFFALYTTRYRYQTEGIKWELGTKLMEQGIDPYHIRVNWAWRPYWYFESTFADTLKKYHGDKTQIPDTEIGSWFAGTPTGKTYYFTPVSIDNLSPSVSEKYWIFWDQKRMQTEESSY